MADQVIERKQFYIDGAWVDPQGDGTHDVVNPATEEVIATIATGNAADVDAAVMAARRAFVSWSQTPLAERIAVLERVMNEYLARAEDLAGTITSEMGAPISLSNAAQAPAGFMHIATALKIAAEFPFVETRGTTEWVHEPIGVCGLITPWNWPANQIMCKVAPALVAGCTMVLKPSEFTPLNAIIITDALHAAGVPAGVFNLVNGSGVEVGAALAAHPEVDMMSFTGSTRAGVAVAQAAAPTVKRVSQELGGKSPNIILESADLETAVTNGVRAMMQNTGQSCNAPSRMFVPQTRHDEACAIAAAVAQSIVVGDPLDAATEMGPVANANQYRRVRELIDAGQAEGATLVTGGADRPDGIDQGYFIAPTVFGGVTNDMRIAREEIFGPVLCILPYQSVDEAIELANDTDYGLSGYVFAGDASEAASVGRQIRAGQIHLNGAGPDFEAPFGGYKQSGNGREWGPEGLAEFVEVKALLGAV